MKLKKFISSILTLCLLSSSACAEGIWGAIEGWFTDTTTDVTEWVGQAWEDTVEWTDQAWDDVSEWTGQAWDDVSEWTSQAWTDSSAWVKQAWTDSMSWAEQAWKDSSGFVSKAWTDSTVWIENKWNHFTLWLDTVINGTPFDWINDMTVNGELFVYNSFVEMRSFLDSSPDEDQIHNRFDDSLSQLSLLEEDRDILWNILSKWAAEKQLTIKQVAMMSLPYVERLIIQGSSAIGEDVVFSGPVIAQYLITILESIKISSADIADEYIELLFKTLNSLTRPVVIGDTDQNAVVTQDGFYIENFSYKNGKYQVIMLVSAVDEQSTVYPLMRGKPLDELTRLYFKQFDNGEAESAVPVNGFPTDCFSFVATLSNTSVTGKSIAIWTDLYEYLFFIVTDDEWNENEFDIWFSDMNVASSDSIVLSVDMESDGAFYGINQTAQRYTINRIFDEEKFLVPKTGHGWAAERGNNLIDNIKGVFMGQHSIVVGDNNVVNGPDRLVSYSNGTTLMIQSKYYSSASRSIAACFDENGFRYYDAEGKPMAIEIPADQYEEAVVYMKNRIRNGQVHGVDPSDTEQATEIVKKGSLTYQQAKHIAKAGTVESILYDSAHACISAGTAMGLSAAVDFAVNLWNGASFETAVKSSIFVGLEAGGTSFLISVLSSQLARTGLNTAMIPASRALAHALGPKVSAAIVNAFRPAGSAIYGAAAMQSAAKLLRGGAITAAVTFVIKSVDDVADIIQGKISWKQLAKNTATTAVGIAGGYVGYLGGAALGTVIFPGAGTVVGAIFGVAVGAIAGWGAEEGADALADLIADDDAEEMIAIIETSFAEIAVEYFLNEEEVNQAVNNLQTQLNPSVLKKMYQCDDRESFARVLIELAIDPVVMKREYIKLPGEEEYAVYVSDAMQEIYSEMENQN